MTAPINAESFRQYRIRFSLIVEQILAFTSSPNMVREVKNLYPNLKLLLDHLLFMLLLYS